MGEARETPENEKHTTSQDGHITAIGSLIEVNIHHIKLLFGDYPDSQSSEE